MRKILDSMALNEAVSATVEEERNHKFLRIRPRDPKPYYGSHGDCILLSPTAMEGLLDLLVRNGVKAVGDGS